MGQILGRGGERPDREPVIYLLDGQDKYVTAEAVHFLSVVKRGEEKIIMLYLARKIFQNLPLVLCQSSLRFHRGLFRLASFCFISF